MTITAVDIRAVTNKVISMHQLEEAQRRTREYQERESRRLTIMARAVELFEHVLEEIKKEAAAGRNSYHYSYGMDSRHGRVGEESQFKAEAIEQEARNRGFKTSFEYEDSNLGDSAAPCFVTNYWLEIGW